MSDLKKEALFTLPLFAISLFGFSQFVVWIEARPGGVLPDPLLALFPAHDVSFITFTLIYGAMAGAIFIFRKDPKTLLRIIQSYLVMIWMRVIAMYFFPLSPPTTMISLIDPFVQLFTVHQAVGLLPKANLTRLAKIPTIADNPMFARR